MKIPVAFTALASSKNYLSFSKCSFGKYMNFNP